MNIDFQEIQHSKNLLAFSAGVDSSALFFLLKKHNITFDIAIVNYNKREQSKEEISYAKELAKKHQKKIFIKELFLDDSNFEKIARDKRYKFFEELISKYQYEVLITAHQLDDKLEWFMMQLTKGAGLVELIGFNTWEQRQNYSIYKPLLEVSKEELKTYLDSNRLNYFVDKSNYDEKYKRNYFRHNFTNELISNFKDGISRSFKYLDNDVESLNLNDKPFFKNRSLEVFKSSQDSNLDIRVIDKNLKKRGIIISNATRKEILKQKEIIVSNKIAVAIQMQYIFIAPFIKITMDKKFKDTCRVKKVPKTIRGYLYKENIDLKKINF